MISSQILKVDKDHSVGLLVRNLTVTVSSKRSNNVKILDDVSFKLEHGLFMAIMGGSGSGKTTLLNTLSQRLNYTNKNLKFSGEILYFSGETNNRLKHVKNAYLVQTDCFLPGLSVYETLQFQADLRMPATATSDEKTALIETLLEVLELQLLKHEVISTFGSQKTNLSGGEQRRVSLAIQLLSKPSILFLDEPTTGLDTSSSLKLAQTLRKLASLEFNLTIILSIHQPRPEISVLFDKICLLTRGGRVVYYGNLIESWSYFSRAEIYTPQEHATNNTNELTNTLSSSFRNTKIMEYIMDLSVKDTTSTEEKELESIERINSLVQSWKDLSEFQQMMPAVETQIAFSKKDMDYNLKSFNYSDREHQISFLREVYILTKRTFILSYRDKISLIGFNGGSTILGIVTGWMFFKPAHDIAGMRSLISCLYTIVEVIGFCPMFFEIERLWECDMIFFYREYQENYVSILGFLISRRLGKFLLEDLPLPTIFACITYFMFGLRTDGGLSSYFFIYLAVTILVQQISMALALFVSVLSPSFGISATIINMYYQLQSSGCGYFVNASTMPVYVRWTKYLAYFWYAFGALCANQFTGWEGDCPYELGSAGCAEYSGNFQLEVLGYPQNWIKSPIVILLAYIFMLYIGAMFAMYFRNHDIGIAKTKADKISSKQESKEVDVQSIDNNNDNAISDGESWCDTKSDSLDIRLSNITLDVIIKNHNHPAARKSNFLLFNRAPTVPKTLLDGITANFRANTVNAIMGPSGSGKTTLLNFLSHRLLKSSKYVVNKGRISLNHDDRAISAKELSTISAYVTQHDSTLIADLTVRETLYYQARLRLPREEHKDIPTIINHLIRRIGLSDCSNTLIGDDHKKGISGGEKRRVSIAIQLLSRPKILFLDEPTSGLDSTTASSILKLLNELASESKATIITTIHQPSEDIFLNFSNVLLLARGGKVAYNGSSSNVKEYFESLGFGCPPEMNIADFFLDLVSNRFDEDSETTQERISNLVENWSQFNYQNEKLERLEHEEEELEETEEDVDISKYRHEELPISITLPVIASRQLLNSLRAGNILFARGFQTFFLALVYALYFSPLKNTQEGISNRLGLTQGVLNIYYVGFVSNITLFPIERDIFYQEFSDGIYGPLVFSASYLINELPWQIIPGFFFSAMVVFVIGLPRTPAMFFSMFLTTFVATNCGESLGIIVNCIFDNLGLATNIISTLMILAIFMGGTMSLHMPEFFRAWNYINPMKYAVGVCSVLGFKDQTFECANGETTCALNSGENVLEYYGLDQNLGAFIGALIACLVIYRMIAVAALCIKVKFRK